MRKIDKGKMLALRLEGHTYQDISRKAGISRQRIQQLLSPPSAIRKFVLEKYKGGCDICGIYVGTSGHVHHRGETGLEDYNDIENLILLCRSCHRKEHSPPPPQNQCRNCGISTKNNIFCSRKCIKLYYQVELICSECKKTFTASASRAYARLERNKCGFIFCSKRCYGKWFGKKYGQKKKYDYAKILQTHKETGFRGTKLSPILGIPIGIIDRVIRKSKNSRV